MTTTDPDAPGQPAPFWRRRATVLAAVGIAVLAAGVIRVVGAVVHPAGPPNATVSPLPAPTVIAGGTVPDDATRDARDLIGDDATRRRDALSSALAGVLPAAQAPVPGTTLKLEASGWNQVGDYASVRAVLARPKQADVQVLVGFVRADGAWRITFVEPVS